MTGESREAARTVAAHFGLAAVPIVITHAEIGAIDRLFQQQDTVGTYTAHYYDATGKAVILYYDKSHNKLAKARLGSSTWSITSIGTGGHEIHVSRFNNTFAVTNVDDNFDFDDYAEADEEGDPNW